MACVFVRNMGKVALALCAGLMIFSFAPGLAKAADLNAVLDKMQKTYSEMNSMVCEFEQTLVHKESGSEEKRKGEFKFKKPLLLRWAVDHELLVFTKKEIWDYLEDEEIVYRYSLQLVDDSSSFVKVVTGQANVREDFEVTLEGETDGLVQMHMYPKRPTQQLTEVYFWVEEDSGIIRKLKVFDFFGNENGIVFTKVDLGASVPDSTFSFTPPKGVEVEDHIDSDVVPEKNLFQ